MCGISMITRMMESGVLSEGVAIHFMTQWSSPLVVDFQQAINRSLLDTHKQRYESDAPFCHLPDDTSLRMLSPTKSSQDAANIAWALRVLQDAQNPVSVIERFIRFRNLLYLMRTYREPESRSNSTIPQLLEAIFVTSVSPSGKTDRRALLRRGKLERGKACCSSMSDAAFNRLKHAWNAMIGLCMMEHTRPAYRPLVARISKEVQTLVELDILLEMTASQRGLAAHIFFGNLFQGLMHDGDVDLGLLTRLDSVLSDECLPMISGSVTAMILCTCAET